MENGETQLTTPMMKDRPYKSNHVLQFQGNNYSQPFIMQINTTSANTHNYYATDKHNGAQFSVIDQLLEILERKQDFLLQEIALTASSTAATVCYKSDAVFIISYIETNIFKR